jgi:hypothetical protein
MKPSLYLETTIPSFLAGTTSPVLATAGHQAATAQWWKEERNKFRLFVSSLVEEEIKNGKSVFAQQRRTLVAEIPRLEITTEILNLGESLHSILRLPPAAKPDAMHLAIACHHEIDYLLTWNMKHLANGHVRHALQKLHNNWKIQLPTICTPEELMEEKIP